MKQWHFFDKVYRRWVVFMICGYEDFRKELEECELMMSTSSTKQD